MRVLLALIFFFVFYKGLQEDNPVQTWGGLILMVLCLVWQICISWEFLAYFLVPIA